MSDIQNRNLRFHDFVMDQMQRRKWVGKMLESDWLQKATFDLNIDPFEARALILGASASSRVYIETEVDRLLDDLVRSCANRRGQLARDDFRKLAKVVRDMSRGTLDQQASEQMVKEAVERKELKPKGSGPLGSKRWFRSSGTKEKKA